MFILTVSCLVTVTGSSLLEPGLVKKECVFAFSKVEIHVRANLEVASGHSNFCLSLRGTSGTKFHDFTRDFKVFFCF